MSKEAMKLALEALEETRNALAWFYDSYPQDVTKKGNKLLPHVETVLTTLREELAEQPAQQEPVAWIYSHGKAKVVSMNYVPGVRATPLYTSPPAQRTWVGLTNEEVKEIWDAFVCSASGNIVRNIEAKLKEKNT